MENEVEFWRQIAGYEGIYEISTFGRIRSLPKYRKTKYNTKALYKGVVLKPILQQNGYVYANLHKSNKPKLFRIHRLVAIAFIPNSENKPQINHKNGIKTDNSVVNLEWVTASENVKHAYKNGLSRILKAQNGRNAILKNEDVKMAREIYNTTNLTQKQIWEKCFKGVVSYSTIKKFFQNKSFINV